jgi:hypothetical protein
MSNDLEKQLRAALRPVSPRTDLGRKIMAKIAAKQAAPSRRPSAWWLTAGIAASLVVGIGVHQQVEQRRVQQNGLEARRQVMQALHVTSQKLDLAYEAVKSEASSFSDEKSGV